LVGTSELKFGGLPVLSIQGNPFNFDAAGNNAVGQDAYLFYFPGLGENAATPGLDQSFGFLNVGTVPPDPGNFSFNEQIAPSLGNGDGLDATYGTTAVPTPATGMMAIVGLVGLAGSRRFSRRFDRR
jgi:hypothetical protein